MAESVRRILNTSGIVADLDDPESKSTGESDIKVEEGCNKG